MPSAQKEKSSPSRKPIPSKRARGARKTAGAVAERVRVTSPQLARFDEKAAPVRSTKQEQVLTLLSRPNGVSVQEVMKATGWQMHSVRGFFAGTVQAVGNAMPHLLEQQFLLMQQMLVYSLLQLNQRGAVC
jgi:hypothetical protein